MGEWDAYLTTTVGDVERTVDGKRGIGDIRLHAVRLASACFLVIFISGLSDLRGEQLKQLNGAASNSQ